MEARAENLIRTEYSEVMQKSYIDYELSEIRWVNIIRMVTVPFMNP